MNVIIALLAIFTIIIFLKQILPLYKKKKSFWKQGRIKLYVEIMIGVVIIGFLINITTEFFSKYIVEDVLKDLKPIDFGNLSIITLFLAVSMGLWVFNTLIESKEI